MDAAHKPDPAAADTRSRAELGAEPVAIADERLDKLQEPALAEAAAQLIRRGAIVLAVFNLVALAMKRWAASAPPLSSKLSTPPNPSNSSHARR